MSAARMARLLSSEAFPELVLQLAAQRHEVTTLTWPLPASGSAS